MVRLTDRLNITIAVDWDVKPESKQISGSGRQGAFIDLSYYIT